jgi:hypothetical protein
MAARATRTASLSSRRTQSGTRSRFNQLSINTIRTLSMDAVQQAIPATPARRWPGDGRLHGMAELPRFDPTVNLAHATASRCPTVTLPCCSMQCSISTGVKAVMLIRAPRRTVGDAR